jgi:riboflavin kinase / FMN adenylyltransferase
VSTPAHFESLDRVALPKVPIHVAIGMFDGVHLGHRAVIESAVQSARHSGGISLVLTFSPHPSVLFRPESPTRLIMDIGSKMAKMASLGVDAVVVQPFTRDFAAVAATDFVPFIKRHLPRLAGIYVGENFRFGQGRKGDVAMLVAEGKRHGITVFSAPRVNLDGEPISSTRIRERIQKGDMKGAAALLGYVYTADGTVMHGKHLGRTIGFPTLNLGWSPDLRPL